MEVISEGRRRFRGRELSPAWSPRKILSRRLSCPLAGTDQVRVPVPHPHRGRRAANRQTDCHHPELPTPRTPRTRRDHQPSPRSCRVLGHLHHRIGRDFDGPGQPRGMVHIDEDQTLRIDHWGLGRHAPRRLLTSSRRAAFGVPLARCAYARHGVARWACGWRRSQRAPAGRRRARICRAAASNRRDVLAGRAGLQDGSERGRAAGSGRRDSLPSRRPPQGLSHRVKGADPAQRPATATNGPLDPARSGDARSTGWQAPHQPVLDKHREHSSTT